MSSILTSTYVDRSYSTGNAAPSSTPGSVVECVSGLWCPSASPSARGSAVNSVVVRLTDEACVLTTGVSGVALGTAGVHSASPLGVCSGAASLSGVPSEPACTLVRVSTGPRASS